MCGVGASTESEPWVFYRGAEYLLAKQPFDWNSVSMACRMMGAYLVSIHSREELHFIKERLQQVSWRHCRQFSLNPQAGQLSTMAWNAIKPDSIIYIALMLRNNNEPHDTDVNVVHLIL